MPTMNEIRAVKKRAETDLINLPGVTGVSIGPKITGGVKTDELAIVVYVEQKKDVPAKERIPKEIQGIKTDVVQRRFKPNAFVPISQLRPAIDATRYADLRGGMSLGPCRSIFLQPPDVPAPGNFVFVGTLGALVTDNGTGEHMLLTNFHVAAVNDGWVAGDAMCQPARPDGGSCPADTVGELARVAIQGVTAGGNPGVDGAVIRLTEARPTECSIIGIGDVKGTAAATAGMAVRKRGRTTELTFGRVSSTDMTVSVDYGDGIGTVIFEDQIEIEVDETQSAAFGISGDSGSVVVDGDARVVGLYFAGSIEETDAAGNVITPEGVIGIANPIAAVEAALNVKICARTVKKVEFKEGPKELKEFSPKEFKEFAPKELKEFSPKELKEFGPKELKERGPKELKDFGPKEFKEFGPKEFKERGPKEFKEPKEIFEDKIFDDKFFEGKQIEGGPGGLPGGGLPGGGFPGLEDRLRRLEAILARGVGAQAGGAVRPAAGFGCIDFAGRPPGATPNPLAMPGASFLALDHLGNPWPNPGIKTFGAVTGLDTGFAMTVRLDAPCPAIRITLAHFSAAPTVEAFDAAGTSLGARTVTAGQGVRETITLPAGPVAGGGDVVLVTIRAPADETLISEFCGLDSIPVLKPLKVEFKEKLEKFEKFEKAEGKDKFEKFEKPELKDKPEKLEKPEKIEKPELKDKPEKLEKPELKEKPEKIETKEKPEIKEKFEKPEKIESKELEPKRIKELEPKQIKELEPKQIKELEPKQIKEFEPKQIREDKPAEKPGELGMPPVQLGGLEERLARLEAAVAQGQGHFIDPRLRPDLRGGALRAEPDAGSIGHKVSKDAYDSKQSKDIKDSEKPSDG